MPNIFKDGGGAGIGSYVVVFKDGQLDANTFLLRLRNAYKSGEQIYFSIDDAETKDALVPASGWVDNDLKLHLVARDFDDNKTYTVVLGEGVTESEISVEVEVKDGIEMGEGEVPTQGDIEEAKAKLAGNSLVIPEQPQPEPVFVDPDTGTEYFHKQEFDLEAMLAEMPNVYAFYDVITGQIISGATENRYPYLRNGHIGGPDDYGTYAILFGLSNISAVTNQYIASLNPSIQSVNYTSRAFTVVDTQEEVTDNTKICLPTCSAYYGFLSEDGKTFISYYNLKSDATPAYVDSVKQGNASIPLHDSRVDNLVPAELISVDASVEEGSTTMLDVYNAVNALGNDSNPKYIRLKFTNEYPYRSPTECTLYAYAFNPGGPTKYLSLKQIVNKTGTLKLLSYMQQVQETEYGSVLAKDVLGVADDLEAVTDYLIPLPQEIPAGGTKLYKHEVAIKDAESATRYTIKFISASNIAIQTIEALISAYFGDAYGFGCKDNGLLIGFLQGVGPLTGKYYIYYFGTQITDEPQSFVPTCTELLDTWSCVDTVAEL